ncbi:MAG: hypothetical protein FWH43_08585, partial [Endomicrobia bacterium]|nr:hypothetical protein [Endomicrobiia bacterium]
MKLILGKKFDEQPEIKDQNPVSKSAADGILKPAVEKAAIAGMVKAVPVAKIKQPVLPIRSVIGASPDSVSRSAVSKTAIADIAKAVSAAETKQPVLTADNLKTMQAEKVPGITPDEVLPARRQFLYEAVEKREQNGKHYVANDGTVTAIFQNQAVHFLDPSDNKFKDIDNSLRDIGNVLEAKTSDFNIQFNKNLAQGKVFELTKKDCAVSLISREVTAVRSGLKLENTASLNRVQSELILKNIKDNTDFQYIVESDRVKENIIINKKADSYEYNFDLNIENLTVNMSNDGKILELKSKKTSEVVFSIPAPSITDAKGAYSDFVYYEIENQNEKTLNLKVVASAEWLNAGDRVFPAVINPQIVSKDTSLFLLDKISDSINDMSVLTVKKDLLNLDSQKISKVTLKLQPNLGEILGVYHSFDITDIFIEAKKDLIIELKPDFTLIPVIPIRPEYVIPNFPPIKSNPPIAISIEDIGGQNPPIIRPGKDPILEVEYLTSDDSVPAKEDFALAGGVTGALNLNTGEFVTGFTDAITKNSALACKISHVYKKNSTNYGCGKNWRLNLHQTLVKNTAVNAGVDYIYTDSDGEKHGFIETYYYLDSSNNKVTVPKNDVIVELDGSLWYKSGSAYEVFKDQRTATGLTLTTKMEGFKNVENLEQRQNEQKQIEEYIESCKNSFKECVIAQTSDGKIIWELKNYFSGELLSAEFNKFVSNGFTSGRMILSKGEAMQYASLLIQKKQVEDQLDAMNKQKMTLNNSITSLGNSITSLDHNKNSINTQIEALVCQRESLKMQLDILKKDDKKNQDQRTNLDNQIQLIGEKNSTSPVIVNSVTLDTQIRYLEIQRNDLTTQKADLTTQKNDLTTQKNDIDKSISSMQSQKTATVKQIEYISGKISDNLKELKRIFKEYTNKEFELKKLKEQMPVSYLSDGNSFLCFNEAGKLCAITDNYSNYISIEYDNNGRISKVYDGKRATVLKYNFYGQLVSITDYRGKKTTYTYSSTSASGNLTKATYSDGNTLEFVYAGEEVTSISSSADKTKTLLAYSSGKLSAITNQSTVSSITDTSAGLAAAAILTSEITVSAVNINYSVNECAITTDGKLNWYIMDRLGNLVGGYSKLTDGTDEERLSYSYFDRANNWCYLAKETDDPVALPSGRQVSTASGKRTFGSYNEAQTFLTDEYAFASGNNLTSSLSGLQKDFSAYVLSKNSETSITVQAA